VLVRHGQGVVNVSGRIGGVRGCSGLTELGRAQVAALARRLARSQELSEVNALYASVLPRAIETAEILAPALGLRGDDVIVDCALCELHPGEADDLLWEDYVERFGVPDWDVDASLPIAPGGESWTAFVDRVAQALRAIAARHPDERVVIATHAGVIESSMIAFLLEAHGAQGSARLRLPTGHASLTEWEVSPEGWRLLRYNDASHQHED
jgi:probable phosphoglycerate mutase